MHSGVKNSPLPGYLNAAVASHFDFVHSEDLSHRVRGLLAALQVIGASSDLPYRYQIRRRRRR